MATRFLVVGAGSGTWSSAGTGIWSTLTGGTTGASAPTSADDVIIDGNSGSGTVNIDTATNASCQSLDSTNGVCTMSWQNSATSVLKVGSGSGGKVIIGTGMTLGGFTSTSFNAMQLVATSSNGGTGWPITTNAKTTPSINFNGSGGRWQFQDAWTYSTSGAGLWTATAGTIDTNGKTITGWAVQMSGGTILGTTATFALAATSTAWSYSSGTFTSSGETINCTGAAGGFAGGGQTYKTVTFSGGGTKNLTGNNTFTTLTVTATGSADQFLLGGNQTITGTFTLGGTTSQGIGRLFLASGTIGATRTLTMTGGTLAFSGDVDFQDITVSGSPTVTGNASVWVGDCLGNTFGTVTATTPVTSYWVGHTASWNNPAAWASSPGGSGSTGRPPLPQDSVVFESHSFSAGSQTTTMNYTRACVSIDFSAATNNPTFSNGLATTTYGSMTLVAGMSIGGGFTMTFQPRSVVTLTQAGGSTFFPTVMGGPTGTLRIVGSLTIGNSGIAVTAGTFDALTNNVAISAGSFTSGGVLTRTVSGGSTGWSLVQTGNLTIWNVQSSGLTTNLSTTTISLTGVTASAQTFSHGGGTLGGITVTKNNAANSQTMIFLGAFTCNTYTLSNAGSGTSTFQWGNGQTFTATTFAANKTGTNNLLIQSNGAGLQYTMANAGTVPFWGHGLTIQDSVITGTYKAFADSATSTISNTSGWTLAMPSWTLAAASMASAGAITKQEARTFAGGLTSSGSITRRSLTRPLTAAVTSAGALTRSMTRSLSGGLSFVGGLTKSAGRSLAGGLSFTGTVTKNTGINLTGGVSFVGAITGRALSRTFSAVLDFIGSVSIRRVPKPTPVQIASTAQVRTTMTTTAAYRTTLGVTAQPPN